MKMGSQPENLRTRLIIAIDYGTTYTGVAYATPAGKKASLTEIDVVQDWGDRMRNQDKVPSVISYSGKVEKSEQQWGSDLSKGAIAMVHTKLQLDVDDTSTELDQILESLEGMQDLNFQYIKKTEGTPRYTRRGPEEIVADYLERVFEYLVGAVSHFTEEWRTQAPVDIVATIPAEWGYRAKNSTFRALRKAGFNEDNFPQLSKMLLVSEPEAAAIYTARHMKEKMGKDFLRVGECFVLCDAGGGTVDLVSYKVKQLEPAFEIEPIGLPASDKCGAIFINLAFKKWLRKLIGQDRYRELDQRDDAHLSDKISSHDSEGEMMRTLMKQFETKKRAFTAESGDVHIDLPECFHDWHIDDRVEEGEITIPSYDMQNFFEHCAGKIVNLISNQREYIESHGIRLKNVFLVGGFAESPYLQASIRESLDLLPVSVELRVPNTSEAVTAVVRGAAIFGIEKATQKTTTTMSACPRSYGVLDSTLFSEVDNQSEDRVKDTILNMDMAKDQLRWLIKKGDLVLSNRIKEVSRPFDRMFTEYGSKKGTIPVFAYNYDDLPERYDNSHNEPGLSQIYTLEYDLGDISLQEFESFKLERSVPFYVASLVLKMRIAPQGLRVQLWFKDRLVCAEKIGDPILKDLVTLPLV
ncbi:hypothetical protein BDZ45DRAFT_730704 [Acephala macrosclerotiorum]|nr:hypothetical protein BDZ45DRAFT_730704 [Acephala macrosclerotiorum]